MRPAPTALKVFGLSLALAHSPGAFAQPPADQASPGQSHEIGHHSWGYLAVESGIAGGAAIVPWLGFDTPTRCNWCQPSSFDVNARDFLKADDPRAIGFISHGVSLGAVPVLALVGSALPAQADHHWEHAAQDAWIMGNVFLVTTAIGNTVKKTVARQRPAFHFHVGNKTEARDYPSQEFLSFFSLDTAWAFSIAASGATLAYLRHYDSAPWLLGGGAILATTAGAMRISADMHWATDVMTGALVGTAVGVGLPLLLHSSANSASVQTAVSPTGFVISGVF
jgi:membrane-associated phospholipid phosphatase